MLYYTPVFRRARVAAKQAGREGEAELSSKTALVTGGAGFIGSHLAGRLLAEGWQVRVLDNFNSGEAVNLAPFSGDINLLRGDIRDMDACRRACEGVDSVFHMAALASVVGSIADPIGSHEVNLGGTLNMLTAARDAKVRRFVFSSSAAIYGNAEILPTQENQPYNPQSPYAAHKACGEFYCKNFNSLYGLEAVILRYFNVFGPRQSLNSGYAAVIPLFIQAALDDRSPTIFGDGKQTRDFIYVENIVAANLLAATQKDIGGVAFNIAGGEALSLLQLVSHLENIIGRPLNPAFKPERAGEVKHSYADVDRASVRLGFAPRVSVAEGLRQTYEAYREEAGGRA